MGLEEDRLTQFIEQVGSVRRDLQRLPVFNDRRFVATIVYHVLGQCPVIPVTVVAKPNRRYRLEALPPITIERSAKSSEMLQRHTQELVDALLPIIAAHPEQWFQFAPLDPPAAPSSVPAW